MSKQTRKGSAAETATNLVVGYSINFAANFLIFPLFGWNLSVSQNLGLGVFYTIISIFRQYTLRRIFNHFNFFGKGKR